MSDLVTGGMFSLMVVKLDDPNAPDIESRLAEQVARSPSFFANAPVVVDLGGCAGLASADAFQKLKALFKRQHLILVGVQNANGTQVRAAMNADLAAFAATKPTKVDRAEAASPLPDGVDGDGGAIGPTLVITRPVRSGEKVYAKGADLIVLNQVGSGADIIADGHVHVYGSLRGRAFAGARGDASARIFVRKLEAEFVCVAGHYLVSEAIAPEYLGKPVQIALVDERIVISPN